MIRRWLITLALIVVVPLAVYLFISRTRVVPWDECSELYRRYADCPGVEAAYIKDYRVNDTLTLCATVLEAQTDSAWAPLQLALHPIITEKNREDLENGLDILALVPGSNCHDSIMNDEDFAVLSLRDKYVCVFHVEDSLSREYLIDALWDKIFNSLNNKQKMTEK